MTGRKSRPPRRLECGRSILRLACPGADKFYGFGEPTGTYGTGVQGTGPTRRPASPTSTATLHPRARGLRRRSGAIRADV